MYDSLTQIPSLVYRRNSYSNLDIENDQESPPILYSSHQRETPYHIFYIEE